MEKCIKCKIETDYYKWESNVRGFYALCEDCYLTMIVKNELEESKCSNEEIICPYCEYDGNDTCEYYEAEDEEYECESCGKEFTLFAEPTIRFTTYRIITEKEIKKEVGKRKRDD